MVIPMPKSPGQWAGALAALAVVAALIYFFTDVFRGKAVEVTVVNGRTEPIFAYIDKTGRHGSGATTTRMKTSHGSQTPPGLVIGVGAARSFGVAVGWGDQPTLHVLPVQGDGMSVDPAKLSDCSFDTVSLSRFSLPPWHVKVKVNTAGCTAEP